MSVPTDDTPLGVARGWLRERVDEGERCPCCTQMAKVYRRKIGSSGVKALVILHRIGTWVHVPSTANLSQAGGDVAKLAYWGLVAESPGPREDGGRAGWWKITAEGEEWLLGKTKIMKYARIYDGRLLGFEGEQIMVEEALGKRFNLRELMAGK